MSKKDTGGPAFPRPYALEGMTLRDYFAAKAMEALVADPNQVLNKEQVANWAYAQADAMLAERKR